jgi:hypothetical protein
MPPHVQPEDLNPYANRVSRVSKLLRAKRVKHDADDSDDDEIDMNAFPHLQMAGLPGYVTRSREGMRGSPASEEGRNRNMKGKEAVQPDGYDQEESQAYLGPAIKKMSSGLGDAGTRVKVQAPGQVLDRPRSLVLGTHCALRTRELTPPEASPTVSAHLMRGDRSGFEDVSLDDGRVIAGVGINDMHGHGDFDVKSDTTVKPTTAADGGVEYEEDHSALPSPPIGIAIPLPPPTQPHTPTSTATPARGDTVLHHYHQDQHQNEPRTPTTPRPPIIMINDDTDDPVNSSNVQLRNRAQTPIDYLGPLINIGNEAGAGDINDIQVFEPREAGNLGGRYWSVGGRRGFGV